MRSSESLSGPVPTDRPNGSISADGKVTWPAIARADDVSVPLTALGGGLELTLACHYRVVENDNRIQLGLPEIKVGLFPGGGGTQRLTRAIGKAKAMDMVLTARMMDAAEAERAGLASRVVPHETLMEETRKIAARIAAQSPLAVMANKEMVNAALETTLTQGVQFERRLFHSLFAFDDQSEGMAAFVEKRKPDFRNA